MAVLNKIKGATLMETLVSTVLIFVLFMMASATLNHLFSRSVETNTRTLEARLNTLQYLWEHDKLQLPYTEAQDDWLITVERYQEYGRNEVAFEATHKTSKKEISVIRRDD